MAEFAYEFWKRVDELKGSVTVTQMCKDLNIKYTRIRDNRSENRYPSKNDMIAIADYLHTSIDYLMTGKKAEAEPSCPEAEAVKESPELQALVRAMTKDPKLLQVVAAIIEK